MVPDSLLYSFFQTEPPVSVSKALTPWKIETLCYNRNFVISDFFYNKQVLLYNLPHRGSHARWHIKHWLYLLACEAVAKHKYMCLYFLVATHKGFLAPIIL